MIVDESSTQTWLNSDNQRELYKIMEPYEQELIIYECNAYVDGTMALSVWNRSMLRAIACAKGR